MNWLGRLLWRKEQESHLDKELHFHVEQRVADLTRCGLGEEEARRKVRLEFGGMDQVKEDCRDARGTRWIEDFGQDARYALRLLGRNPAFAAIAIATLALGIGINTAAFTFFNAFVLRPDAFTINLNPDWRIFAFVLAVSIAAGVLFGLAPAMNSAKASVTTARSRFRDSLVVAQVAICLALLVASGLLLRSMWFVEGMDPGFKTVHLYATSAGLTGNSNPSLERSAAEQFALRLAELPGIQSVSTCYKQPLSGMSPQSDVMGATALRVAYNSVGPQYFRTVGIPMIRGRDFTEAETKTNAAVAIVSEGTASRVWPGEEALGKTIRLVDDGAARQVVGVVRNARVGILWRPEDAYVYLPIGSKPAYTIFRAPSWSPSVAELTLRNEAARVHPALKAPVSAIEDSLEYAYAPFRFLAAAAGLIATLALVLASVGLYGVVSLAVSQRTREIGIRMALGARSSDVMRTVFRSSLRLVAIGVALGLGGGLAFAKLLALALIGIKPLDLVAFASTSALMALVAALATWAPARRATGVDPMVTLRHE